MSYDIGFKKFWEQWRCERRGHSETVATIMPAELFKDTKDEVVIPPGWWKMSPKEGEQDKLVSPRLCYRCGLLYTTQGAIQYQQFRNKAQTYKWRMEHIKTND